MNEEEVALEVSRNGSGGGMTHVGVTHSEKKQATRTTWLLALSALTVLLLIINLGYAASDHFPEKVDCGGIVVSPAAPASSDGQAAISGNGDVNAEVAALGASLAEEFAKLRSDLSKITDAAATNLPGMESKSWESIVKLARSQQLNFYLWSPENSKPRKWIEKHLSDELQEKYGVSVNRISAVYKDCDKAGMKVVCDVADEVAQGKTTDGGAVDLIWINGANFKAMKEASLLYGPWATLLPNSANFDFTNQANTLDKGVPTAGLEIPFHSAQSVFIHDKATVPKPPMNMPSLVSWIKANPGKFVYSDPTTDFTGATFIRLMFYHYAGEAQGGSYKDFLGEFNEELYVARAPALWAVLNEIESSLYQPQPGTPWYPEDHNADIRPLVADGTLLMDFSFEAAEATNQMNNPKHPWPTTMQAYVPSSGTIGDTNFLAIPINSANKEAALVAANHIASAGSQFTRAKPEVWGALQAFDPSAPAIKEWDVAFDYIQTHSATPSVEELAAGKLPDLAAEYVSRLNADWETLVKHN
jgi:ABC-type uncharacterized transport system YnjBCD substrate-binding protein